MSQSTIGLIGMILYLSFFLLPFIIGIGLTIYFIIKHGTKHKDR